MKRLAIIVPYRDRQQHLDQFVPHMRAYFARDKLDKAIDYRVLIVEQERGLPFNRGALKNAGFLLTEAQSDYSCFHDIDYLPIWADYSFAEEPTPIVWYGAEERPIAPGRTNRVAKHDLEHFFGGALIVPNSAFRAVNGYSNDYWGWGYEDEDIKTRIAVAGIATSRRKGTFLPLVHDSEGFKLDATPSPIALVNQQLVQERWAAGLPAAADGLSGLEFEVISRANLPDPLPERTATWELVKVRLLGRPSREQEEALAAAGARPGYRQP
jgi:glycosyl transferase family 7 (putative galactosyltransferase)